MKQRDVDDNATGVRRWDPEQPRSEDRTDDGQVKKNAACQSLRLVPAIFWDGRPPVLGSVARGSCPLATGGSWVHQAHGGVRLLPCARIPLCFVLAVDLSTERHPVRARGTWDLALPGDA